MKVIVSPTPQALGLRAAQHAGTCINQAIAHHGSARIVLSTGASQFDTISALIASDIDWGRVEMFHLDEYIGLPATHPASFRKYLQDRFISQVKLKRAFLVDGQGDTTATIAQLNAILAERPVDVGLIGIGENAHIAFNDPPADFDAQDPYIVVTLNDTCKAQQVREGWFPAPGDVPEQAISMSVRQIMRCRAILSCVPYAVKAQAVYDTLSGSRSPMVPATILKDHPDATLYLDTDSAALCDTALLARFA